MTEQINLIPARIKSAVVNGHVAGTIDIIDDALGKDQQEINADTYRKEETYSKEQLNNLITTPEQEYVTVTADAQTTDVTDVLPATGEADTVYRVGNWDGTQYDATAYSEYAWDGTQYQLLSKKQPGIDDVPTAGSNNLVKSGGVYNSKHDYVAGGFVDYGFIVLNTGSINNTQNPNVFKNTGYLRIDTSHDFIFKGNSSNQYINCVGFYRIDKTFISGLSHLDPNEVSEVEHRIPVADIPSGTYYIVVCAKTADKMAFVSYIKAENPAPFYVDVPSGSNIYNQKNPFYQTFNDDTGYVMPVASRLAPNQNKLFISGRTYNITLKFYDEDFERISQVVAQRNTSIDIPSSAMYVSFIDFGAEIKKGTTMINYGGSAVDFEPFRSVSKEITKYNTISSVSSSSMSSGNISISVPDIKCNQIIGFRAKVTTFGSIELSHGKIAGSAGAVVISTTEVIVYDSNMNPQEPLTHGLTINTFIEVIIKQINSQGYITIRTLGGSYSHEISFVGCRQNVMMRIVENTSLTDCKLTFGCSDYGKDLWAFGDSYFTWIISRLITRNSNNALFDGFPGRNSSNALISFKKLIGKIGVPKIVYWALGMNDPDNGSVNTDWQTAYNEVIDICKKYNIIPIFATVPSTPTHDNTYKNAVIKSSGYRYVDQASAVGADVNNNWYTGLLSSDNLHPTQEGAEVLTDALIIDVPELKNNIE